MQNSKYLSLCSTYIQCSFVYFRYNVCLLVITYVVPMTAMAICYGSMSWELWGHTHIGEVTERQRNSMISKRKVEKMVKQIFVRQCRSLSLFPSVSLFFTFYLSYSKRTFFAAFLVFLYNLSEKDTIIGTLLLCL